MRTEDTLQDSRNGGGVRSRILVIDDNEAIHADFRSILEERAEDGALKALEEEIFGSSARPPAQALRFRVDAVFQGQEGLRKVAEAREQGAPYAVAFVDMRMPPGWNGIETLERLWSVDPSLEAVICTAYSDYSFAELTARLGVRDNLLILKKPFDSAEVLQIAAALTRKWHLGREAAIKRAELGRLVEERTAALTRTIAELERTYAHLLESKKLAALGGLVAGVAHEVSTPIGIGVTASSYLEDRAKHFAGLLAAHRLGEPEAAALIAVVQESAAIILSNLERAATLIRSFKQIAVDQTLETRHRFQLRPYLEEVLRSLSPEIKKTSHEIALECPDVEVESYPGVLSQILTNLVVNAITHGFRGVKQGSMTLGVAEVAGDVVLTFRDDGAGMSAEVAERVFEPFFTTNRGGGGSGLGLHIVYNLVTRTLGGRIACTSAPGAGTVFTITLPRSAPLRPS